MYDQGSATETCWRSPELQSFPRQLKMAKKINLKH